MSIVLGYDEVGVYNHQLNPKGKDNFSYLIFLGDMHVGHKDFSTSFLQKAVVLINRLSKKHRVSVILMGDLIETDKDYASEYMIEEVSQRTGEQFITVAQHLKPIADICNFAVWGNHEERLIRDKKTKRALEMVGIDNLFETILMKLNPKMIVAEPQRGVLLRVDCGKQTYEIRIAHGAYGGYKRPELQCEREGKNYSTAALIAMGHHHQKFWKEVVTMGLEGSRRAIHIQYWLGTGTFLQYPAYAERKSYPMNVMGCPVIKIYSNVQHLEYMNSPDFQPRFIQSSGILPLPPRSMFENLIPKKLSQSQSRTDESGVISEEALEYR